MLSSKLLAILEEAYDKDIASSLSLFVGQGLKSEGDIKLHVGHSCKNPLVKTNEHTLYDLASLTKIIGTTPSIAQAIIEKRLSLNLKPFLSWPDTTIKQLLAHTSGLVAHKKFYEDKKISKNYIYEQLFLENPISTNTRVYCDLGFMALGYLLEKMYHSSLNEIFTRLFFMQHWRFKSFISSKSATLHPTIAPTDKLISGQVNDLNCYYMGGLAGHAGLFGDLDNVSRVARFFLKSYKDPKAPLEKLLKYFMINYLSFDKPTPSGSGSAFSHQAFGHFGFTGTSLWIDPQACANEGAIIVLLTNRVYKSQKSEGIFWLRKKINDCVIKHFIVR